MTSRLRKLRPARARRCSPRSRSGACGDSHTKVTTGTYAGESGAERALPGRRAADLPGAALAPAEPGQQRGRGYLQGLTPAAAQAGTRPGVVRGVHAGLQQHASSRAHASTTITITRHAGQRLHADRRPTDATPTPTAAAIVPAKGQLPAADTTAPFGPTQGALLLFKIQIVSLDNRPLEVKIVDPIDAAESASAELDV